MTEYIERESTVELLRSLGSRDYRREKGTIQEAIKMVSFPEYTPSANVVSRAAYDQVAWERDLALTQLREDYGVGLGEKKVEKQGRLCGITYENGEIVDVRIRDVDDEVKVFAKVRYGRWIHHDDGVITCSVCDNAESHDSNFCRYCGAMMGLEEPK